jgi:hypothetical protein
LDTPGFGQIDGSDLSIIGLNVKSFITLKFSESIPSKGTWYLEILFYVVGE